LPTSQLAHVPKRRSTRIDQVKQLTVWGLDASREPYVETVPTSTLSCHGCRYRSTHAVLVGDIVLLEVRESARGPQAFSTQARVRWLEPAKGGNEGIWDVAVELVTPGNVWGVESPPKDWLLTATGPSKSGQELRVLPRAEQQMDPAVNQGATQLSVLELTPASQVPFLAELSEHVQKLVYEAVTTMVINQKDSVIGQFRAQLQDEMNKTLDRIKDRCQEELVHRALRDLTKELESFVQSTQEHWVGKIKEGLNGAATRINAQATQVSDQIENMGTATLERLQLRMDTLRREASGELRIGSLKICQQTEDFCKQSEQEFVSEMQQRVSELKNQFESNVNERLARVESEFVQKSSTLLDERKVALLKLSEACQETVQGQLRTLAISSVGQLANTLNERAAELSKQCMSELQDWTSRYLESISGSIAEVSKKTSARRHD